MSNVVQSGSKSIDELLTESHLVREALRLGATIVNTYDWRISFYVGNFAVAHEINATPEEMLEWINQLKGLVPNNGGQIKSEVVQNQSQTSLPEAGGEAPLCPTHQESMRTSKFGGWYCTIRGEDGNYCKQKIK